MLLAILLPDPQDPQCPQQFKKQAQQILAQVAPSVTLKNNPSDRQLRETLLNFIGEFANWDNAAAPKHLHAAKQLIHAAHPEKPTVADPFAGGGSIPLEALRIGCDAFATDLNPVACLILRAMLEEIPKNKKLPQQLRETGAKIRKNAEAKLAHFYPKDHDGAVPVAYLWARTVRCESPKCGAEIPLARSFWLVNKKDSRKKGNRKIALRPIISENPPAVGFEIFQPKPGETVHPATVERANAACMCCKTVLPADRVRAQLAKQRGGANALFDKNGKRTGGARMLAVANSVPGQKERFYRLPDDSDYAVIYSAEKRLAEIMSEWETGGKKGLCPIPDEPLPPQGTLGFNVRPYGMTEWNHLFTPRQKLMLVELVQLVRESDRGIGDIRALFLGQVIRHCNINSKWHRNAENVAPAFAMQTLPISWDFPELSPFVNFAGTVETAVRKMPCLFESMAKTFKHPGQVQQADACEHPLTAESADVWFTDPPYYDAIPYADLSDFFLVWLKRMLPGNLLLRDPFDSDNPLSPKLREAIQDRNRRFDTGLVRDAAFYEKAMASAFANGRRVLRDNGIASVVFAHKTTKGWEVMISGLIKSGWTITASWPIATESPIRLRARNAASLATSVHLICRPRPLGAKVGEWANVLRELPGRVGDWMERLQGEGVRGADLIFSCIGPALEIFSRYPQVEKPDGTVVELAEYLRQVWETVARTALEDILGTAEAKARNGAAGAVEEDARLTALFLWTMRSTRIINGGKNGDGENGESESRAIRMSLPFDVVRCFAQPLGVNLDEWEGRIIETRGGVVSLIPVLSRLRQLFGDDFKAAAGRIRRDSESEGSPLLDGGKRPAKGAERGGAVADDGRTTLDRVHMAMLLHQGGKSHALRDLIADEKSRGPNFLRLVNALAALYPRGGNELRWVEGVASAAK